MEANTALGVEYTALFSSQSVAGMNCTVPRVMPQTGRRSCYIILGSLRSSNVLEPQQNKGAIRMLAGVPLLFPGRRHLSMQRETTILPLISAPTQGNCRFPCTVFLRSASYTTNSFSSVSLTSTEDEEEPNENSGDGDIVDKIRRNHRRIGQGKRVVVGMSGGVDSSVAAMLLQQQAS